MSGNVATISTTNPGVLKRPASALGNMASATVLKNPAAQDQEEAEDDEDAEQGGEDTKDRLNSIAFFCSKK